MKKVFKSTLVVVAVVASCLSTWKAFNAYDKEYNSLLMENLEALSSSTEGAKKEPVSCATVAAPDKNIFPWYNGTRIICSNGYSPDKETCMKLQRPACTSRVKKNVSGSDQQKYGWCIPIN